MVSSTCSQTSDTAQAPLPRAESSVAGDAVIITEAVVSQPQTEAEEGEESSTVVGTTPTPRIKRRSLTEHETLLRKKIDTNSAAALDPLTQAEADEEDAFGYALSKVQRKYGGGEVDGELLLVGFVRQAESIGLSLSGNKDRNRMSVFIVATRPELNTPEIHVGDEILEVQAPFRLTRQQFQLNGCVIYGRSHLNASSLIRTIKDDTIRMVLARRPSAFDEMAVRCELTGSASMPATAVVEQPPVRSLHIHRGTSRFVRTHLHSCVCSSE